MCCITFAWHSVPSPTSINFVGYDHMLNETYGRAYVNINNSEDWGYDHLMTLIRFCLWNWLVKPCASRRLCGHEFYKSNMDNCTIWLQPKLSWRVQGYGKVSALDFQLLAQGLCRDLEGNIDLNLWWEKSAKGIFTTKSMYDTILRGAQIETLIQWKEIWNFNGPTRGSVLLSTLAHNRLKTNSLL